MSDEKDLIPGLPLYVKKVNRIYESKKLSGFLDSDFILSLITFGNRKKLVQAVLRDLDKGMKVLQIGATFGSQIDKTVDKIGYHGNFYLVDVSKTQIDRCKKKYKGIMHFSNQNGLAKINDKYDAIVCFMLLHELPPQTRAAMVENLLGAVKEDGKVIFVDYNKPEKNGVWNYIFRMFNRLYRPFVEEFLEKEISQISSKHKNFTWHKTKMFGGFYQKVIAIKK